MAVASKLNPFTAEQLALADTIIDSAETVLRFYADCKDCGLEVNDLVEQVTAYRDFAERVKRTFGR